MGKKRKSIATSLDEVDRTMYASFCSAANSLSQLYTQAMNQQKLSFQAGERHSLEKLYQWIRRQQEGGSRVTTLDILSYLQNELEYSGEEPSMSPRAPVQQQHSQLPMQFTNPSFMVSSGPSGQIAGQGGYYSNGSLPSGTGARNNESNFLQHQNRESNPLSSNDSSMEMHADSPHESTY
ncbi:hypothetical protein SLA2020_403970 [Shorea laevis]